MNKQETLGLGEFIGAVFHAVASFILKLCGTANKALDVTDKGLDVADSHADRALAKARAKTAAELKALDAEILVIEPKKAA